MPACGGLPRTGNFTVAVDALWPISTQTRVLLCLPANSSYPILEALRVGGYRVATVDLSRFFAAQVRSALSTADVVLLDVTTSGRDIMEAVQEFNSAIGIYDVQPRLLCFCTAHRNPHFVLGLEKCGARYTRISSPAMLLEAIELLLAEVSELQRTGPCFQIIHRFSRGRCAPGEEISAIQFAHGSNLFQLPLALTQRLVFDFLAQHRRIAVDAMQIVSGLSSGWFYRDHAGNSGLRQIARIRVATVKVLVQRIRKAMAAMFARAQMKCDPCDVLRSFPAEGSRRILYKLHANVRWDHFPH